MTVAHGSAWIKNVHTRWNEMITFAEDGLDHSSLGSEVDGREIKDDDEENHKLAKQKHTIAVDAGTLCVE